MPLREHHRIVSIDDRLDPGGRCTRPFPKYFGRPAVTHRTEAWDEIPATPDPEEGN